MSLRTVANWTVGLLIWVGIPLLFWWGVIVAVTK